MEKEKPLEELTVKELKEMALALGGITGVSAMKKAELIQAIKEVKGVPVKEVREKPIETVIELKQRFRKLKARREELRQEEGKKTELRFLKKKLSRLKKRTRRMARKTA
jgi:hypothetical protein